MHKSPIFIAIFLSLSLGVWSAGPMGGVTPEVSKKWAPNTKTVAPTTQKTESKPRTGTKFDASRI